MGDNLIISKIQLKIENGFNELGGFLDNDYIYFRVPEKFQLHLSAEWFVGVALLEAMATNRTIEVDDQISISAQLLEQVKEIQAIFSCWNPDLNIVDILGKQTSENRGYSDVGSFFSGGVDGSHTLTRHMKDISHLIMFRVFDMGDDQTSWNLNVSAQTTLAASLGKSLVPIETNARDWTDDKKIAWSFAQGLLLSTAGSALGLKRLYIASSHSYDGLFPWGTHALTDPMWSTESTKVIHDGAACSRTQKTREILKHPEIANNLKVCWNYIHKNCGTCSKCVRTMSAIYLLGGRVESLPLLDDLRLVRAVKATSDSSASSLEDLILLAKEVGNKEMLNVLRGNYRKYQRSKIFPLVDQVFFGGAFRQLYRKLKKPRWLNLRVTLRSTSRGEL